MARVGVFQIPREIADEDKWFKYFNKKQAVIIILTTIADYRFLIWANMQGFLLPAIIVAVVFSLLIFGILMIKLPLDALFLSGGGLTMEQWLIRYFLHSRNKKIYVKNYFSEDDEND